MATGARSMRDGIVDVDLTAYQLVLGSLRLPVWLHYLFNGLAATGMLLLGHPLLAAALFLGASAFDTLQQALIKRWLASSAGADEARGLRRLALLSVARITVYTTPAFAMALTGGLAEAMFYGLQLATLLAVAVSGSALSRLVCWAMAAPMVVEVTALILLRFDPLTAGGLMLGMLILLLLTWNISTGADRTINAWHKAFTDSVAMAEALAAARDQAVAERTAADSAREAARQANRAKSNFLATMSHEIRTPMNGVLGMAQLMKRDETDPVQAGRLDVLIDSGEYLLAILNDILDVSKIDAGKLELVPAAEDLPQFLSRLVSFWTPRADERGVALELRVATDVPDQVLVDALRLRQVMFNLIGNALKFTAAGSVQVIAEAASWDHDTVQLHLAVRDTGPGIAPQHLAHLFDRFSQADESEARRFGGTGLGLAIVKQLVELMGGRVWVESELGQGSTFHLEVPLEVLHGGAALSISESNAPQPMALEALRLLTVDDNAVNLLVLDQLLSSLGHEVTKADSGAEALAILAEQTFDLLLTDIQMPGMTGTELLHALRAAPGPNQSVPVIALTADVTSGGRQRYLDQGFTEHAAKPIQLQDLLGAVVRAVGAGPAEISRVA